MRALVLTSGGLIAAKVLNAWIASGHSIAALWTGAVDPGQLLRRDWALGLFSPSWSLSELVRRHRIPVRSNPKLSSWSEAPDEIDRLEVDVLITPLTRQIVPANFLARFGERAVNFHPALLPHYRGPNPRSGMILDGTASLYGGVSMHVLSHDIDGGNVIGSRSVPYDPGRGFVDWNVRQARAAGDLVEKELQNFLYGAAKSKPQREGVASYRKVRSSELLISEKADAGRIEWLCDVLGDSGWLRFNGGDGKSLIVSHFMRRLGPRSFRSPCISRFDIEFDAANARVKVARRSALTHLRLLALILSAVLRTSLQARWRVIKSSLASFYARRHA